jgi:hypothetical protein
MKKYLLGGMLLGVLMCNSIGFAAFKNRPDSNPLEFNVHQQDYTFSTVFEMNSKERNLGSVVKSSLRVRTNYDLYDSKGKSEATGICRILTLGAIYSWAREIDLYDTNEKYIGMIDGQAVTGSGAKFSIYDAVGNRTGIAYLDNNSSSFTILNPKNERLHLAKFKRNFIKDTIDNWDVTVYEKEALDLRAVKIFAAFAVDTQEDFKEDL